MKETILVVDDEPDALELIRRNFAAASFQVLEGRTGEEALYLARMHKPHLVILDHWLPGVNGLEVCRTLKMASETANIPVIMLTANNTEIDRVLAFELGVDDYVTKPFSPRELVLRVRAILRRKHEPAPLPQNLASGNIQVDFERHYVTVGGQPVDLTAIEFKLLAILLERRGCVQSRDALVGMVWGAERSIETRTVDTHLRRLREKLGAAGEQIATVRGFGYRLDDAPRVET
jgi:two-component system phosphate regulon response regulator PhoB